MTTSTYLALSVDGKLKKKDERREVEAEGGSDADLESGGWEHRVYRVEPWDSGWTENDGQKGKKRKKRKKRSNVGISLWFPFLLSIFPFHESVNILFTNCCGGLSGW